MGKTYRGNICHHKFLFSVFILWVSAYGWFPDPYADISFRWHTLPNLLASKSAFYEYISTSKKYNIFIKNMSRNRLFSSKKYVKASVLSIPPVEYQPDNFGYIVYSKQQFGAEGVQNELLMCKNSKKLKYNYIFVVKYFLLIKSNYCRIPLNQS